MRFIDATVFVHAYIKPRRLLKPHEKRIKENAKSIVKRVNEGERVLTTTVHLGEIANILEDFFSIGEALKLESSVLAMDNVEVMDVSRELYMSAVPVALENRLGLNDSLASVAMEKKGVFEIYSFDKDFDKLENLKRITE